MRKPASAVIAILFLLSVCGAALAEGSKEQPKKTSGTAPIVLNLVTAQYDISLFEKAAVEAFMKENPNVSFNVVDITSQANDYMPKLSVMLAGGEKVDVNMLQDTMFFSTAVAKGQALMLDDLIKRDGFDLTPYGSFINEHRWSDGKLYGLPERMDHWILFYNKRVLDKAGIPYPTAEWTWNDYREAARKLTRGAGNDKVYGTYIHTWPKTYYMMGLIRGEGTISDGAYSMLKDGMQFLLDIQLKDKSAQDYATNKAMSAHYRGFFEKDDLGLVFMGTWLMNMLSTDRTAGKHNIDYDVTQLPQLPGKGDATMGASTPFVVQPTSKNIDMAWKFLKFLCGEPGAKIIAGYGALPAYRTDEVMKVYGRFPDLPKGVTAALKTDKVYLDIPVSKNSALLSTMINEEIDLFASGNKSIDQTIADMEKRRKEILSAKQ